MFKFDGTTFNESEQLIDNVMDFEIDRGISIDIALLAHFWCS